MVIDDVMTGRKGGELEGVVLSSVDDLSLAETQPTVQIARLGGLLDPD